MWLVRFTEAARAELIEAQDWYEAEAPGLSGRFRAEIDSVVRRIADNPRQFPTVFKTLVITGPKALDFYAGFCAHRATSVESDGKDILSVTLVPNSEHLHADSGNSL